MEYILQEMANELAFSDKIQERSGRSLSRHQHAVHREMLELPSSVIDLVHQKLHEPNWSRHFKPANKSQ